MSEHLTKAGSSTSSAGLLLRVSHADGRIDEFYLANGLTIGRTLANTVVLADDETVDRTHARVDFGDDGSARLRCLGTDNVISLGNTTVRELGLTGGVAFHIGQTSFECIPGQRAAETGHAVLRGAACPHCGSRAVPAANPLPIPCPSCGQAVLALDLGLGYPTPFVVPIRFGDFQAQRFVTRGGMGLVLRGQAEVTEQPVAIKILLPGKGVDRQASERFKQEIALMKRVVHPNVVRLLSYGRAGLFNFLVMEWVDGHNLRDAIIACKQQQRLPRFDDVFPWLEQMCKGLAAIHAVGIVHRDIKPSNVLIAQDGRILVTDLGVAKRTDQGQTALTTTGQLPGTYEYMAPEQLAAPDTVDQRTDLYSLGVMFYELLTGERPVGAWLPASQVNPGVPLAVDQIVSRLLARKAANRYADIHELLAALSVQRPRMETGRITSASEQVETPHDSFLGDLLTHLQAMGPANRYVDIHRLSAAILASYPTPAARPGTAETVAAQPPLGQPTSSVPEVKVERTGRQGEIAPHSGWLASNQAYTACLGGVVFLVAAILCFWCAGEFGGFFAFTASLLVLGSGCLVLSVFQWIEVLIKVAQRSSDKMAIPPSPSGQATSLRSDICGALPAIATARRFLIGQVKDVASATYAQTRRLAIWCAALAKARRLARQCSLARLLLGLKLLETRTGSADTIARINEIKELIATDLPTIWQLRRLRNESRELTLRLAEEVLAGAACPPEALPQYSAAVAAEKSHDEHRDRLRAMYTSLGPTNSDEWRRVAMGYGVLIAVVLMILSIFPHRPIPGQAPNNPMPPAGGPTAIAQPPDKKATIAATAVAADTQGSASISERDGDRVQPREITNSIGMKLRLIPAGEFLMGSRESAWELAAAFEAYVGYFQDDHPQHRVRITKPFYLGAHEVTVGQFRQFVQDRGYRTEAERDGKGGWGYDEKSSEQKLKYTWQNTGLAQGEDHPVVNVSWNDAVAFCEWLSRKEGKSYRLPTEAQWEYACRAGTTTRYHHGDDPEGLYEVGNVADASFKAKFAHRTETIAGRDGYVFTAPVGSYRANGFGLYDMHGNVWEWCADWYDKEYYANSPTDDPQGHSGGPDRVIRGGGWIAPAGLCRSASRGGNTSEDRSYLLGFRVSRAAVEGLPEATLAEPLHLRPIGPQNVEAGKQLTVPVLVENAESLKGRLRFSLDSNAPPGSEIKAQTGEFTWTPARDQSPGKHEVAVSVEAPDGRTGRTSFAITVTRPSGLAKEITVDMGGGVAMEMVLIPAGTFTMGDDNGDGNGDEKPAHQVNITRPFYLGKYEVTQEQWEAVMGGNPSLFKGPRNPVDSVSWTDCQGFVDKLNAKSGGKGGKFTLPTEAQWEYARRARTTTQYSFGGDETRLGESGWYDRNSGGKTHPVGEKKPNAFGLYDMHGNVWEWCADWYDGGYYAKSPADDPTGPTNGSFRVNRGGGWYDFAWLCRSASRYWLTPDYRDYDLGFRVSRVPAEK